MMDDGTKWMIRRGEERDAKAKKKKKGRGETRQEREKRVVM